MNKCDINTVQFPLKFIRFEKISFTNVNVDFVSGH